MKVLYFFGLFLASVFLFHDAYAQNGRGREKKKARKEMADGKVTSRTQTVVPAVSKKQIKAEREALTALYHATDGDFVTVRLMIPASETSASETEAQREAEEGRLAAERREAEEARRAAEKAQANRLATEQAAKQAERQVNTADASSESKPSTASRFALRVNLLRWATLTPDLGLEWRLHPSWGILVNGSWTSWSWNDKDRRYALWEVAPEVRCYMGSEKRGYLGAMFKAGEFNHKFSATGKQGDLTGGGITGGYLLRLNDALSLDFSIALGYLNADYEKYELIDGVRVRCSGDTKNWWGPINAGVTLVWKLF